MKTLTLCLKITTFLLLIWMYQCFYNCDSYKTFIYKNILQTKNELKYGRVLAEGHIAGKKQTNAEGCLEERPLDNKKNICKDPDLYKDPYNYWRKVMIPQFWDRFIKETREMDSKSKLRKWNDEFNNISNTKVNDLYSISRRRNIPNEEKIKKIDSIMRELNSEFEKFLFECKKEMTGDKTESESKKDMTDNKTESESVKEMIDNKTESASKNEVTDNKTETESMNEMIENKTESESKKEITDNKTESESNKEITDNKTESESMIEVGINKIKSYKLNICKFFTKRLDNLYENKN
ncbi:fam-g protein [Plasmodium gallinaceum]|uniref:Fam-g protein n=1 Tax=Plasmodium gallinaceum TaxID=5849 RepID=A0A1J1H1J0_PLAGA|nr:fam-g protein [Plasmodium gallinaceum]CRG97403.1 fam-g protein [Plasmodium gallinaceum]